MVKTAEKGFSSVSQHPTSLSLSLPDWISELVFCAPEPRVLSAFEDVVVVPLHICQRRRHYG